MPAPLVYAVSLHHRTSEDALSHFSPLTAVHCADAIATADESRSNTGDGVLDFEYLNRLGLSERVAIWAGLDHESICAENEGERCD